MYNQIETNFNDNGLARFVIIFAVGMAEYCCIFNQNHTEIKRDTTDFFYLFTYGTLIRVLTDQSLRKMKWYDQHMNGETMQNI